MDPLTREFGKEESKLVKKCLRPADIAPLAKESDRPYFQMKIGPFYIIKGTTTQRRREYTIYGLGPINLRIN